MTDDERVVVLREELADQQDELRLAVSELETAARRSLRPREQIRRRPLMALCGGFLLGWWVGWR